MKRKSVSGFIIGLIGSIISVGMCYIVYVLSALILALNSLQGNSMILYKILLYAYILSPILAIIAICFYFSKARTGGIIMLIASLLNFGLPVFIAISTVSQEMFLQPLLLFIPAILMLISAMFGIFSKKQSIVTNNSSPEVNLNETKIAKYCQYCGTKMEGNKYCTNCGHKFE